MIYPTIQTWFEQNARADSGLLLCIAIVAIMVMLGVEINIYWKAKSATFANLIAGFFLALFTVIFAVTLIFIGLKP